MTTLKFKQKPVWHQSNILSDGRYVLVAEQPEAILLRLKGTRQVLSLPIGMAHDIAARLEADRQRAAGPHRVQRSFSRGTL